jgi:hypothetical protein
MSRWRQLIPPSPPARASSLRSLLLFRLDRNRSLERTRDNLPAKDPTSDHNSQFQATVIDSELLSKALRIIATPLE